ncbi:hypothetical protein [Bilophila wadsworthia]|uniref:hypothetical protein n=1 Tax=Bilophila wadsworthia TaxID=35833 RepID=UPI00242ABE4A|nr:hypothetical protein [Bilophila wadsworthia]
MRKPASTFRGRAILDADHSAAKPKQRIRPGSSPSELTNALKGPHPLPRPGLPAWARPRWPLRRHGRARADARLSLMASARQAESAATSDYVKPCPARSSLALKHAKSNNPLFCLDEIDKMKLRLPGRSASALLEVLDPSRTRPSTTLSRHRTDLPKVFFITTKELAAQYSRSASGPYGEIIELSSYLEVEKKPVA